MLAKWPRKSIDNDVLRGGLSNGSPYNNSVRHRSYFWQLHANAHCFGRRPGRYPRLEANYTTIERSIKGSAARRGPLTQPTAIWTFEARLSLDQQETLRRMEAAYWGARGPWTLYDYTNYWFENGNTNTRALAPNSTALVMEQLFCIIRNGGLSQHNHLSL